MISLSGVSKSFNSHKALDDLSLQVASGEIYGLLGANGAGKSTTLNLLLGFLKPDKGVISISNSNEISSIQLDMVGYIPENVILYPYLSGLENLDYFCRLSGLNYDNNVLSNFLDECGLQINAHKKKIASYSKGMRQKVGIAIAYAKKAQIYLLDEPASGLDPVSSNELSDLLRKLSNDGASILMASHDLFRVRESCHKIGILKNGTIVKEMQSSDVSPQELESIYINFMKN